MAKRTNFSRIVCTVLLCALVCCTPPPLFNGAWAADSTTGSTRGDELAKELAALREKQASLQKEIDAAETAKKDAASIRAMYKEKAALLDEEITAMQADIATQESNLDNMRQLLADKVLELQATKDLFGDRLAAMYIRGSSSDLEVLLGAESFADMLRAADDLQQIAICDTDLIDTLRTRRDDFQHRAKDIQTALDTLNEDKAALDDKMTEYGAAIAKANNDIAAAEQEKTQAQEDYAANAELYKQKQAEWAAWAGSTGVTNTEYMGSTGNSYGNHLHFEVDINGSPVNPMSYFGA